MLSNLGGPYLKPTLVMNRRKSVDEGLESEGQVAVGSRNFQVRQRLVSENSTLSLNFRATATIIPLKILWLTTSGCDYQHRQASRSCVLLAAHSPVLSLLSAPMPSPPIP